MSGPVSYLLIDIGNTSAKYAYTGPEGDSITLIEVLDLTDLANLSRLIQNAEGVYVSAVAHKEWVELIHKSCQQEKIGFTQVLTSAQADGLTCAYQQYQRLGVDRWLAMIAGKAMTEENFAVIDLGTAATCDFVNAEGLHLGGWIAPGFSLMKNAVSGNTVQVSADDVTPEHLLPGKITEDCVNFGAMAAVQGIYWSAVQQLQKLNSPYKIFICGGNRHLITDIIDENTSLHENLVLLGLARLASKTA